MQPTTEDGASEPGGENSPRGSALISTRTFRLAGAAFALAREPNEVPAGALDPTADETAIAEAGAGNTGAWTEGEPKVGMAADDAS